MKKRLSRAGILLAGLLYLLSFANLQKTNSETLETAQYSFKTPCAGATAALDIISTPKADVEPNIIFGMVAEAPIYPELATLTYSSYTSMGYSEETFYDDLEALALICLAEAENQSELGKRLVIDTVLNRMDSDAWSDNTIYEVITHPGQYEAYWNGRINAVEINEEITALVIEELVSRTNTEVIYFNTGGYAGYGYPIIQVDDHYFCGQ